MIINSHDNAIEKSIVNITTKKGEKYILAEEGDYLVLLTRQSEKYTEPPCMILKTRRRNSIRIGQEIDNE
jgi:hypothetical protein